MQLSDAAGDVSDVQLMVENGRFPFRSCDFVSVWFRALTAQPGARYVERRRNESVPSRV